MDATQLHGGAPDDEQDHDAGLTLAEYQDFLHEIDLQPSWRHEADREMDYADGNQLGSDLLRKQQELGIPPAIEDLIGPALLSIQGYEATVRTDWRVTANGGTGGQDVADAINYELNTAERHSKADAACSAAFRGQIAVGIGWVEVRRESDPFKYPYRCVPINRNEIHWDFSSTEPDLSDARFLRRQRWLQPNRVELMFPKHRELIRTVGKHGASWWADEGALHADGGASTGLRNAWAEAREWTVQESRWFNPSNKEVCLAEVWYRRWESVTVIRTSDGRVVEYDDKNVAHVVAVAAGVSKPQQAVVSRVRRSYWLGPHKLDDSPSPYSHNHFPYVPFWGFREDSTRVPYGYVRGMIYQQDSVNSGISKLRWGLAAVRTERTKGAVAMTDAQLRRQVARIDADIVLDADHMSRPGARFEVKRDFQLNGQQFQLLNDSRQAILRVGAVTASFMGRQGTATSGLQEQTQVEQSNQNLAAMMDNFRAGRSQVGELLMSMIIEDMGDREQVIIIEGDAVREDRTVVINRPEVDPHTGMPYLSNDLQRTRLKVALEDVPSTASYRGQQLNAMSEAVKSLPAQYQVAMLPFMVTLMDVPFKRDVVEAIRKAGEQQTPEQVEQQIEQAVKEALAKSGSEAKLREVAIKERLSDAQIRELDARAVQIGVQAAYSAMQGGAQIAQNPQIAPIADAVMQSAGYQAPNPVGQDPNYPQPERAGQPMPAQDVPQNTSPAYPPVPEQADGAMRGIETPTMNDNL